MKKSEKLEKLEREIEKLDKLEIKIIAKEFNELADHSNIKFIKESKKAILIAMEKIFKKSLFI